MESFVRNENTEFKHVQDHTQRMFDVRWMNEEELKSVQEHLMGANPVAEADNSAYESKNQLQSDYTCIITVKTPKNTRLPKRPLGKEWLM